MQTTNDDRQVVTETHLLTPMVSLGVVSEMQPPPTRNDNLTETGRFQASQVPGEQSIGILLLPVTMVMFATHKLCAQSMYMELGRPYRGHTLPSGWSLRTHNEPLSKSHFFCMVSTQSAATAGSGMY